ncbi:hemin uptake protein HemP [Duganella sp. 1411]|jgi:hemin uptake protein HemP|nr:hemin uptake protein HemP [Duganella sp. 1411]MBP1204181.1 hemin uptake protein HemP [Duganella sp. 1411]
MTTTTLPLSQPSRPVPAMVSAVSAATPVKRISSAGLMDGGREVEIEHAGRVYRLRVTQLNKLILTA